jgi:predicted aconitase
MLDGERGDGVRRAMEIVVALGTIYGAERLVPVSSVQVSGVSYKNLGDAGIEFLESWAAEGARAKVPTMLNPAGMDLRAWEALGFPPDFAARQLDVIRAFRRMGVRPTCTCTPYLAGTRPRLGDHVAWGESSAVSYANSVLGARTNREGGPSALAAAVTGRTACFGLHLDERRRATVRVEVSCPVEGVADFGALGWLVGRAVADRVPLFSGIRRASLEELKALGAAMAASGAVALYHVEGLTPEARRGGVLADGAERLPIGSLAEGYAGLDAGGDEVDFVSIGCPHASLRELREVADLLDGRKVRATLWVTTSRPVRARAARAGLVERIERSGGRVVCDTCLVVAPVEQLGFRRLATNSGKGAFYAPAHCKLSVRYGSTARCVEAAVTGRWPGVAR